MTTHAIIFVGKSLSPEKLLTLSCDKPFAEMKHNTTIIYHLLLPALTRTSKQCFDFPKKCNSPSMLMISASRRSHNQLKAQSKINDNSSSSIHLIVSKIIFKISSSISLSNNFESSRHNLYIHNMYRSSVVTNIFVAEIHVTINLFFSTLKNNKS